jgi:hypothetical protein
MSCDETLREYTNRYFENRNTLAGVKDKDVISYYKKGITNIKMFEKIHETGAHTIGDLVAYVDKLVDTKDAVMHDISREDHGDEGTRSRKRSGEAYVADPPRPSTFLEGDFNMVLNDQCQFHRDAKHTMRECEQLKRAQGSRLPPRGLGATTITTGTVANVSTTMTVDLIDEITVIADPILTTITGIDMINAATTATMIGATTTVAMTSTTGATTTGVIVVMITTTTSAMTDEMIDVTIDVARTTTIAMTIIGRNGLHRHHPKGATTMVRCSRPTVRSTSSSVVAKRPKATDRPDQTPGRWARQQRKLAASALVRIPNHFLQERSLGSHPWPLDLLAGHQPHSQRGFPA